MVVILSLLFLVACGGDASSPAAPSPTASPAETVVSERATESSTMTGSGTPAVNSMNPATPRGGSPATDSIDNGLPDSSPPSGDTQPANVSGDQPELPAGITIGTPRPDDPIVREDPPSDAPEFIPTPRQSSFDIDGDGFLSVPELIPALQANYASYAWPPDYRFDLDVLIAVIEEEAEKFPVFYENGSEQSMLESPFLCAWQYTLRDAMFASDEARIAESVEQLRRILRADPSMTEMQDIVGDAINRAELGDPAPLQGMIDGMGCATMQWEGGTPQSATIVAAS
jgi:hypothetical protein